MYILKIRQDSHEIAGIEARKNKEKPEVWDIKDINEMQLRIEKNQGEELTKV